MNAEIVSVGTELLLGDTVDTNAATLGGLFAELGISHTHRQTVGDNLTRLTEALKLALSRADIVVTIGGLGPTEDDLTRDGIANAFSVPLVVDESVVEHLKHLFSARGFAWTERQLRQAKRPECARPIENPYGTAPGLIAELGGKTIIAMPGPPREFGPMAAGPVREHLRQLAGAGVIESKVLRVCGLGESVVEEKLGGLVRSASPTVAPYAKNTEVHLRVTAHAATAVEAHRQIEPMVEQIRHILGHAVYGEGEATLESVVLDLLRAQSQTLSVAESCSGGLLGGRLTRVAGSSDVFNGGAITYSNELKMRLLRVSERTLAECGAVSEPCAVEMAEGAREHLGSDWALSVTGIAGPGGGSDEKPVGLVYIGVAGPGESRAYKQSFGGGREAIRERSVQMALVLLRRRLLKLSEN